MSTGTTTTTMPRHLLRLGDLDRDAVQGLLDLAARMKDEPHGFLDAFRGETVACYFEKPSTRTRVSFAAAAHRLGMLPLGLGPSELQLSRGETIADTARTLSAYAAAIVMRTFRQADVDEMARFATVPVVNALTDEHHPCQALADLLTLRERFGRLDGLRVAFVGDGDNNVVHSLIDATALTGVELVVCSPAECRPSDEVVRSARDAGGTVELALDAADGVAGADAVYTDVWVSMGDEAANRRASRLPETLLGDAAGDGLREAGGDLPPLPARAPRRGGRRRGDRRAPLRRVEAGGEPGADRAGAPLRARRAEPGGVKRLDRGACR